MYEARSIGQFPGITVHVTVDPGGPLHDELSRVCLVSRIAHCNVEVVGPPQVLVPGNGSLQLRAPFLTLLS